MQATFDISSINDEKLNQFRLETDPVADTTVQDIIESGSEEQVNQLMMGLFRSDQFEPGMFESLGEDLSKTVDTYISKTSNLPDWFDAQKVRLGERVFENYGPEIFMLLNMSSLPLCYSCAKGAQVLFDTGRLVAHNGNIDPLARRLMETAQMVFNVMQKDGLSQHGKGKITIQKVRLIHASIRYYLKTHQKWDVKEFGEPINQEDLAGTLMSFGPVILSGLKKLNVQLSEAEIDAYMHCWSVVGYLMGIKGELLPNTYSSGYELATKILEHQAAESEAGKALAASCIEFINYIVPGNSFNMVPGYLMHYFLEEFSQASSVDLSNCIGIKPDEDFKDRVILSVTKFLIGTASKLEEHTFIKHLVAPFNTLLLRGIIHHFNDGKGVQFNIPPSLRKSWKIDVDWEDHQALSPNIFGNRVAWQKKKERLS